MNAGCAFLAAAAYMSYACDKRTLVSWLGIFVLCALFSVSFRHCCPNAVDLHTATRHDRAYGRLVFVGPSNGVRETAHRTTFTAATHARLETRRSEPHPKWLPARCKQNDHFTSCPPARPLESRECFFATRQHDAKQVPDWKVLAAPLHVVSPPNLLYNTETFDWACKVGDAAVPWQTRREISGVDNKRFSTSIVRLGT